MKDRGPVESLSHRVPTSRVPGSPRSTVDICCREEYISLVVRPPPTVDVFNAVAGAHRREILDALIGGEKAVGTIVSDLSMSQPQVSKHLRVLSEAGLVSAGQRAVVGCTALTRHTSGRCVSGWPSTSRS